ncbi:hypothetical protein DNI29_04425 [Hymenobacter sediminis]|uniref:hypothetical protein n=1 Tax=Hymenobacter sediminis TaxID=2218621 RepID=UPI000DA67A92|nr:hypothetical protein [Hymenobacter sediminis]RPD50048.1 hypothetical protein DNI29_04425 [Hymenobacter sediminis]
MENPVQLRAKGGKTQEFSADHAKRLLAYPGTIWEELKGEAAEAKAIAAPEAAEETSEAPAATGKRSRA